MKLLIGDLNFASCRHLAVGGHSTAEGDMEAPVSYAAALEGQATARIEIGDGRSKPGD
jgi:hypothetical protein